MGGGIVLLSGGLDSATLLGVVRETHETLHTLHITYGQQTATIERDNARNLADHYDTTHHEIDLSSAMSGYAEGVIDQSADFTEETTDDGRSSGYVPMRNLTFLSIAAGYADHYDLEHVYYGAQHGDFDTYPDCRPSFAEKAATAIAHSLPDDHPGISVDAPLVSTPKADLVRLAHETNVPLEYTYSCYRGESGHPCGECPACLERTEAFRTANIPDPVAPTDA